MGDQFYVCAMLDGIASMAATSGDAERAAHLLGATEALRTEARITTPVPYRRDFHDQIVASIHALLDEQSLVRAWSAGRTLSLEAAVDLARTLRPAEPTQH